MIISIHVPKTGGQSFRAILEVEFKSRLHLDYGDAVGYETAETLERRGANALAVRARRDALARDYDIVHGHFQADKYRGLFPTTDLVAFFRDPYQQAVSHYEFLKRQPALDYPPLQAFRDRKPDLTEFIAETPNPQSLFLGSVGVEELAVVGIAEDYERSVALFAARFRRPSLVLIERRNVNPGRLGDRYPIEPAVQRAVDQHRAQDVDLYRRARERFVSLASWHDV